MPFDCWELAQVTWKLYFQTGFTEGKAALASGGEDIQPALGFYLKTFNIQPLTIWELFQSNVKQAGFKAKMTEWWSSTATMTKTGRPIDGIICPVHASSGFPHNFYSWWGYTSLWNVLDYPAVTMPVKGLKISPETDPKDSHYKPLDNPFDKITYDMCKTHFQLPFQDKLS